jgi:hypothetical protein
MSRGTDEAVLEQILREVAALTDVEAAHQLTALEVREIQNESE